MGSGKRFAVLQCAEDSDYVKKLYGGYFGVFVRMLSEDGETWDKYRVTHGEFPDDDEISDLDGFVITGSCNDAHGNDAWICNLIAFLKKLESMKKTVLGICFGHQILARALGGKVGRATAGWDVGLTTIQLSSSKLFTALKMPASLSIIECHRDEVYELPAKAEVLAWSYRTGVEVFKYGDHIMGIQGHPEYTKDILLNLIDKLIMHNLIEEELANDARSAVETQEPDREAWKKFCINFLKEKRSRVI